MKIYSTFHSFQFFTRCTFRPVAFSQKKKHEKCRKSLEIAKYTFWLIELFTAHVIIVHVE